MIDPKVASKTRMMARMFGIYDHLGAKVRAEDLREGMIVIPDGEVLEVSDTRLADLKIVFDTATVFAEYDDTFIVDINSIK